MIDRVGRFELDTSETTMEYGYYYKAMFEVPFSDDKRTIRVWLPGDYDFSDNTKRFPVIYFSDGQNLVNEKLTAFGEWKLDRVWNKLYKEAHLSFIAVGIDSPKDSDKRENELNPPFIPDRIIGIKEPKGDIFVDFIARELKKEIDETFYTLKDKANTAIAGSSMGGNMSFYGGAICSDVFSFSLVFSPAFFLYKKKTWLELLDSFELDNKKDSKFFFFVGGKGFERRFKKMTFLTYKYLVLKGFDSSHVALIHDNKLIHHESSWNKYLDSALYFWLKEN